ncbi:hypothetical protein DMC47_30740 [Nostoc sp. 3335mG]|nr:hypothetical protein DMC47_30740 [Nostoc sp. 3335mG]
MWSDARRLSIRLPSLGSTDQARAGGSNEAFPKAKISTADFFAREILPEAIAEHRSVVQAEADLFAIGVYDLQRMDCAGSARRRCPDTVRARADA